MIVKCQYILLLLLIYVLHFQSTESTLCLGSSTSQSSCSEKLSDVEEENGYHCCYFTSSDNGQQCLLLNKTEFGDFDATMDYYRGKYEDVSIDCKSYYLKLGVLLFSLLILV